MHAFRTWWGGVAVLIAVALALAGATKSLAQDANVAPVVAVHSGSCADFTPEPAFDVGAMLRVPIEGVAEAGEGRAETVDDEDADVAEDDTDVFGDDEVFDENDEGFLAEDIDDDDVVEIGQDLNDDDVLDEDEVLGEDLNEDDALTEDELIVTVFDPTITTVWKADAGDLEFDGQELVQEGPYVIAVHQSAEQYGTILACGPVLDLVEEDQVVVPLQEQANSGYSGVALVQEDSGELAAYLFQGAPGAAGGTPAAAGGGDAAAVLGEDGVFNQDDEGFLAEDIDGDGIVEIGRDADGDGVLTEDEVLGEDADDNGELTEDELV